MFAQFKCTRFSGTFLNIKISPNNLFQYPVSPLKKSKVNKIVPHFVPHLWHLWHTYQTLWHMQMGSLCFPLDNCTKLIVPHFVPHLWHLWHTYKICGTLGKIDRMNLRVRISKGINSLQYIKLLVCHLHWWSKHQLWGDTRKLCARFAIKK